MSVTDIAFYNDSVLLISSEIGFQILNVNSGELKLFTKENTNADLASNILLSVYVDKQNIIWIGSSGEGVIKFDYENASFSKLNFSEFSRNEKLAEFKNQYINTIFQSDDDIIWCGTTYNGAYFFNKKGRTFQLFRSNQNSESGLLSNNIWGFEFVENQLWIATNKGINIYNPLNHKFEYITEKNGLKSNQIRVIFKDINSNIWIGTNDKGLQKYDLEKKKFIAYYHQNDLKNPLAGDMVWDIQQDENGNIWVATLNGLSKIYYNNDSIVNYHKSKEINSLSSNNVYGIHFDKDGEMWLATLQGLCKYRPKTDDFENYKHIIADSNSLSTNKLFSITSDTLGNLWIATWGGGLNRFNKSTKKVKYFTEENGLSNNVVYNIIYIEDGKLWMSTNNGLCRFDIFNEQFVHFGVEAGLQSAEFNLGAAAISPSGELYFGGTNGFNVINTEDVNFDVVNQDVSFSKVIINNKNYLNYLTNNDSLILKANQNNIIIEFSSLNYKNSLQTIYKYRVINYQNSWRTKDVNNKYVELNQLEAGNYILQVQSTNSTGQWSNQTSTVYIIIKKPWFRTVFFRISIVFSLVLLVSFIVWRRFRRIKNKHLIDKKLYELEKQSLKLQMNPHFIFNTLNAIQSYVYDNNSKESVKYLSKFSKLMRMMLNAANQDSIVLSEEIKMLEYYIQLEILRFENKFTYKIIIDEKLDEDFIEIPPMIIQPYIENAIVHGVVPREDNGGLIEMIFTDKKEFLEIKIKDNGVGRDYHKNSKFKKTHKSKGMLITRQRLELLNKDFNKDFSLKIIDLYKDEKPDGTEVIIRIKTKS
jgi:ligand-binding sensor domain-containing protein